jgi:hypothetical protein
VPTGEVEFVSGNHVSTYAARARGDTWAYLGQTVSKNNIALITRPDIGIEKLEDVRERVELPDGTKQLNRKSLMDMVKDADVDACFMTLPRREFARRDGLKIIELPPQPMVFFMTVSSSMKLVRERPDIIERMLKGVLEGIAFFKIEREKTIQILMDKHNKEGDLDRDMAEKLYDDFAPIALWDFHPLREIDDSGFINNLYKDHPEHLEGHGG